MTKTSNNYNNVDCEKANLVQDKLIYAPLYKRLCAFFIDIVLGYLNIFAILIIGLGIPFNIIIYSRGRYDLISFYLFFVYFAVTLFFREGRTAGCEFMKIKVIKIDGSKMNFLNVIFRSVVLTFIACPLILKGLSILMVGTFLAGSVLSVFSGETKKTNQTVWDITNKAVVVEVG